MQAAGAIMMIGFDGSRCIMRILFVCHGNICRSPMAEFVLRKMAEERGIDLETASAATSTEEIGNPVHPGTKGILQRLGIDCSGKRAVQLRRDDYEKYDYIVAMDSANVRNIMRIIGGDSDGKVKKLLEFAGSGRDVADPWYTGDFEATYRDVKAGCEGILSTICL